MVYFVLTPRCFAYRHAATTFYQLQRGFGDRRQHARIQGFCKSYLVLSLFYSLHRGSNGFIAEKTILILYQGSRGGPLFSRGVSNFFQGGVQMLISLETHVRTCYFPEVVSGHSAIVLYMFYLSGENKICSSAKLGVGFCISSYKTKYLR